FYSDDGEEFTLTAADSSTYRNRFCTGSITARVDIHSGVDFAGSAQHRRAHTVSTLAAVAHHHVNRRIDHTLIGFVEWEILHHSVISTIAFDSTTASRSATLQRKMT